MKIAIGSDHAGFSYKQQLIDFLISKGYEIINVGTDSEEQVDYPVYADKVCKLVEEKSVVSELRTAFIIGFLIYVPFIVIDMVVASALMSMGMMMLPPTTISMPFKILLFVLADGWNLVIGNVVRTFY